MSGLHEGLGIAVLAGNAVVAAVGAIAWVRRDPYELFWYLLRTAQLIVVAEVAVGVVRLAQGAKADAIHYVYGVSPLVVGVVCEAARVTAAQIELAETEDVESLDRREQVLLARRIVVREIGVMTIGAILIVTLSLRAIATGS